LITSSFSFFNNSIGASIKAALVLQMMPYFNTNVLKVLYGMSECFITHSYRLTSDEVIDCSSPVPVGRPLSGCRVLLLDDVNKVIDEACQKTIGTIFLGGKLLTLRKKDNFDLIQKHFTRQFQFQ
jgi:hypothetical protein